MQFILFMASLLLALVSTTLPAHGGTRGLPSEDPSQPWACQPKSYDARLCAQALATREQRAATPAVKDPWVVNCLDDQVLGLRRCWAGTFGREMASNGTPYNSPPSIPFQVFFVSNGVATLGPFVDVGLHTFPGRRPTVRVDEHPPISVAYDAGVSGREPNPALVEQLRRGQVARARYHVWPSGPRDLFVELTGFEAAWQRLQQELPR